MGSVGVGAGCSVGKTAGRDNASKGGQGWAVVRHGSGLVVSALMAVNPVGDVLDETGRILAGDRAPAAAPRFPWVTMEQVGSWGADSLAAGDAERSDAGTGGDGGAAGVTNTVIGCVVTNARLSKAAACRAADLSHSGIARSVTPAHTSADGDLLFRESIFLNYPNHNMDAWPLVEIRSRLIFLFRVLKVDTVIVYDPSSLYERNPDHYVTARAVESAFWMASSRWDYPEHFKAGLTPHGPKDAYYFARGPQIVNRVVDIGDYIDGKVHANLANVTQGPAGNNGAMLRARLGAPDAG